MSEPTSDQTAAVRRIVEEMRRYHLNALVHGATVEAWADRLLAALAAPPIEPERREDCYQCDGDGFAGLRNCPRCGGGGKEPK